MKKNIKLFAAILLIIMLLCGCNHLALERNLPGTWRSPDGYTVTFTEYTMTLYNRDGEPELDSALKYSVSGNYIYANLGGESTALFECRVNGDKMTLIYTDSFLTSQLGEDAKSISISLERCE